MVRIGRICAVSAAVSVLVAACGGSSDSAPAVPPTRGSLLSAPSAMLQVNAAGLGNQLGSTAAGQAVLAVAGTPTCGVSVYQMEYATVGGAQEATNATGAIMAPTGDDPACAGPRPVLLYAHGTSFERDYNIANVTDPNAPGAGEGTLLAAMYAAQGFIVVAPNYAGYHDSKLPYHPYLDAEQQSGEMLDALAAARSAFKDLRMEAAPELLLSGYSQGGYVAMATHRSLQAKGERVTAAAPLSGPYALAAFGDAIFSGNVNLGATGFVPMMVTAYQQSRGNLYRQTSDIYTSAYATGMDRLLPGTGGLPTLIQQGKLPLALFSSDAPAPGLESITPPTTPTAQAPLFALGFGAQHLVNNATRLAYLQDAQAHPDGALPIASNGLPSATSTHPLRQALAANDLRGWTPTSPVLLCGGQADPTVFFDINTGLMQRLWSAPSALAPATGLVQVLDVDATTPDSTFGPIQQGFATAKAAVAQAGPQATLEAYHGSLVAPFCAAAARVFFQRVLNKKA